MVFLLSRCRRVGDGSVRGIRCHGVRSPSETDRVFSGAWTAPSGEDVGRESEAVGRRSARPPRRLRGSVLYEVGFGEPCAAVLITPRREARSRSSQSLRCSTFRPPFKCRPKTGRRRSQGFYQQHIAVSSAEVVRSSRSRSARERASLDLRKLVRRGRNRADVRFRDQARPRTTTFGNGRFCFVSTS